MVPARERKEEKKRKKWRSSPDFGGEPGTNTGWRGPMKMKRRRKRRRKRRKNKYGTNI